MTTSIITIFHWARFNTLMTFQCTCWFISILIASLIIVPYVGSIIPYIQEITRVLDTAQWFCRWYFFNFNWTIILGGGQPTNQCLPHFECVLLEFNVRSFCPLQKTTIWQNHHPLLEVRNWNISFWTVSDNTCSNKSNQNHSQSKLDYPPGN